MAAKQTRKSRQSLTFLPVSKSHTIFIFYFPTMYVHLHCISICIYVCHFIVWKKSELILVICLTTYHHILITRVICIYLRFAKFQLTNLLPIPLEMQALRCLVMMDWIITWYIHQQMALVQKGTHSGRHSLKLQCWRSIINNKNTKTNDLKKKKKTTPHR